MHRTAVDLEYLSFRNNEKRRYIEEVLKTNFSQCIGRETHPHA